MFALQLNNTLSQLALLYVLTLIFPQVNSDLSKH